MTNTSELRSILEGGMRPFRGVLIRIAGVQDAEDAFHDACVIALRELPKFRGECQIQRWFWRIVWSSAYQIRRHRRSVSSEELNTLRSSQNIERQVLGAEVMREVKTPALRLWMAGYSLSGRDKVRACRERQVIREWAERTS